MALRWVFTADSGPFRKGLNQMRTETKSFSRSVTRMMAGVFGSAAIAAGFKMWLKNMDALDKRAKKLGASAQELQKLENVAEQNGISASQLTNLLVRLQRRLGDAARGSEVMKKRLDDLGLSQERLSASNPQAAVLALSRAWMIARKSGTSYSDFLGLLDSEARELIPLLSEGPAKLEELFAKAASSTDKTIAKAAELNNRLTQITQTISVGFGHAMNVIDGLAKQWGRTFGTVIFTIWRLIQGTIENVKQLGRGIKAAFTFNFKEAGDAAKDLGANIKDTFLDVKQNLLLFFDDTAQGWKDMFIEMKKDADDFAGDLGKGPFKVLREFRQGLRSAGARFQQNRDIQEAANQGGAFGEAAAGASRLGRRGLDPESQLGTNVMRRFFNRGSSVANAMGDAISAAVSGATEAETGIPKPEERRPTAIPVTSLRSIGGNAGGPGGMSRGLQLAELQLGVLREIAKNTMKGDTGTTQVATPAG